MKELAVIIPIYKEKMSINEERSVKRTFEMLRGYDICFVIPNDLDMTEYKKFGDYKIEKFKKNFFVNTDTYSRLLLSAGFYERFREYKYMLIAQTDTYILHGNTKALKEMMNYGYDYIGAPWNPEYELYPIMGKGLSVIRKFLTPQKCTVGNGGFSLRRIDTTIRLLKKKWLISKLWTYPEDIFFGYYGSNGKSFYRNAPMEVAEQFALEKDAESKLKNGEIPFALHAWEKWLGNYDILQKYIVKEH